LCTFERKKEKETADPSLRVASSASRTKRQRRATLRSGWQCLGGVASWSAGLMAQSFIGGSSARNSLTKRKSRLFASLRMTDRGWRIRGWQRLGNAAAPLRNIGKGVNQRGAA